MIARGGHDARSTLPEDFLSFKPDLGELLTDLTATWQDSDVWDRGEPAYLSFALNGTQIRHALNRALVLAEVDAATPRQCVRLIHFVEAARAAHAVWDPLAAGEMVARHVAHGHRIAESLRLRCLDWEPRSTPI